MRKVVSLGEAIVWPFLLPGNIASRAIRSDEHSTLVRMLVNSLVWTVLGVVVVWAIA